MKDDYLININGLITSGSEAKVSVFDRGFLYGDSIYESTRTFNQKPFRIQNHLDRLFESAKKIELIPTLTKAEILKATLETIEASGHQDATLRIILTRGDNDELGLDPNFAHKNNLIIFTKKITPNPSSWLTDGVSMIFHQKINHTQGALPKTGNYQENILAYKDAQAQRVFDAFMINPEGLITEATTSNAWIIKDNIIYTPPLSDGVLDGITRKTIIEMSRTGELGYNVVEKSLKPIDFTTADECFLSSTVRSIVPVTHIENHEISSGKAGKTTLEILAKYLRFVA